MPFTNPPKPLPPPAPKSSGTGLTLLSPQSRKGTGPGLLVVIDESSNGVLLENGIPSALMKWAEEGYCVAEVSRKAWDGSSDPLKAAIAQLDAAEKCEPRGNYGLVCYSPQLLELVTASPSLGDGIIAVAVYGDAMSPPNLEQIPIPALLHLAGKKDGKFADSDIRKSYDYPDQKTYSFATPHQKTFSYATEAVTHTRNLTFLKKHMKGPYFDLETIWDEHTYYEFETREVENTMNTMVEEPYVNHIPTLTGGIGRKDLTDFYTNHFIFANPADAELELISRTVGVDRVVDEFIFKCTHERVIDWLLPAVPPTNKYVEVPMMAFVNIRGDRLYHEHICWDHATLLRQIGVLPEYMPWHGTVVPKGSTQTNGHKDMVLRLPVGGTETVAKMRDKNSAPSNDMFGYGLREASENM